MLALAACATPTYTYERRNATPAQIDRDREQCKPEAFRPSRFALTQAGRYDIDVLNRCMARKGYTVRPGVPAKDCVRYRTLTLPVGAPRMLPVIQRHDPGRTIEGARAWRK